MSSIKNSNSKFKYSNRLIEAKYKLSLTQQRIILSLSSMIKLEDADSREYKIDIKDFAKQYEIDGGGIVEVLEEATDNLLRRPLHIQDEKGLTQFNWISSAHYPKNESAVIIRIDSTLKPYLLEIKNEFTLFLLNCFSGLRSYYSIRIYMLLKQYAPIGERTFEYVELREILGIKEEEYKLYSDFKGRVLERAKIDVNDHTDLQISYVDKKTGKKVTKIIFTIGRIKEIEGVNEEQDNSPEPPIEDMRISFEKAYILYNEGKKVMVIPYDRNKTRFKECLKKIGGIEKLLEQVKNYKEYLIAASWRKKKDFSAWINDPASYANDWIVEKMQEDKKNGNFTSPPPVISGISGTLLTKIIDEEPEDIKITRSQILTRLNLHDQFNHMAIYRKFFEKAEIQVQGEEKKVLVESSDALVYQAALDRINVKIEVKNV